ncbi:HNH endonuclease [Mycolicibacterium sarraceniae]|uniref:Bacteriophage protein n=1 Tax=Mycolicibacterium sarraceniae TaxID=1534348 RepID=A0A7I7SNU1_9MYCO|nr:HNH endonuclease signature motif containing protein [Mycolicibacterium sarraceniae]BBY58448.1 bacteriophage protein [Mycolicibacterium sarraceniae]
MGRARKQCGVGGCTTLVTPPTRRCPEHSGWKTSPRTASAGRTGNRAWRDKRAATLLRDGARCQLHGPRCTVYATEVDHIVPVHLGGTDDDTNLTSACHNCHVDKTAREARTARGN